MSKVMMALGNYRFSLSTAAYDTLKRTDAWRWTSQDRLTRAPAKQFLGRGETKITLDGTIYPHYRGGLGQLKAMRAEADKGEPLILTDGLGNIWGKFIIEEITESTSGHTAEGVGMKIDFSLSITSYGEDA